ncbi:MAG: hypothetical protein Q9191_003631 [Dirinaria sp. TL-2023a]
MPADSAEVAKRGTHDWRECKEINVVKRGHPKYIPESLPKDILRTLDCNKVPEKYLDAHCGNVLFVINDFCDRFTAMEIHEHAGGETANSTDDANKLDVEVGPIKYNSHEYMEHDPFSVYFHKKFDFFNLAVKSVDNCNLQKIDLEEPKRGVSCREMLWGAWTGCNNKGRGGSVTAGCLTYSFDTLH